MQGFVKDKYRFSSSCPLLLVRDDIVEARSDELKKIATELIEYKVLIRDLVDSDISYSIRNELLNIALYITENAEVYDKFVENKELPITYISAKTGKLNNYIEKYKQFIITYVIIFGNPCYKNIQEYVQVVENKEESENQLIKFEEEKFIKGVIIYKSKRSAIIITSLGEFKKIKLLNNSVRGEEVHGIQKKTINNYKIHIAVGILLVFTLIFGVTYSYKHIVRTIVIENNSLIKIKLEVNMYNRVFDILATTNEGDDVIKSINVVDKDMDTALNTLIEYIDSNKMILDSGIVITVSGSPIKYGSIEKSEEYIYSNGIDTKFNNVGNEHKIN